MRKILHMIAVLTIIGFISGLTLAFMYKFAEPLIAENRKNETERAIFRIFPRAERYSKRELGENTVFEMKSADGTLLGYVFSAEGYGYQGTIKLMAGLQPDLETMAGIEILESQETPGLGQEITSTRFREQFKRLSISPRITYIKNAKPSRPNEIQAITGATVSSSAVVSIVNGAVEKIREALR
jgi:electron transport complex protein RnfG